MTILRRRIPLIFVLLAGACAAAPIEPQEPSPCVDAAYGIVPGWHSQCRPDQDGSVVAGAAAYKASAAPVLLCRCRAGASR